MEEKTDIKNSQTVWPFHRCYRPIRGTDGSSKEEHNYLVDHDYAKHPDKYTRAFLQIQKEMKNLFQYIEPGDNNLKTYSNQIQQLLVRICIEVESNFKAIFKENRYSVKQEKDWKMIDYQIIDKSHRLSDYQVVAPFWDGKKNTFQPFITWKKSSKLKWYSAYNTVKHNRAERLKAANFENLMNAFCGLFIVLTAQFKNQEFSTISCVTIPDGYKSYYDGEFGIGNMLQAKYPEWDENDKYYFEYSIQNQDKIFFRKFDYNNL